MLVRRAWTHWEKLHPDKIFSPVLRQHLKHAYRAYSPYNNSNAYVVSPWLPEVPPIFRSKVINGDQTTVLSKTLKVPRPQTAVSCPGRRGRTNGPSRPKTATSRLAATPSPVTRLACPCTPCKPMQCWK